MLRSLLTVIAIALAASQTFATPKQYQLPIGDPARKDRQVAVALDTIVDTASGAVLTPAELATRLKSTQILLVGESHTAIDFHRVQLQVVRALHEAGRRVLIGLGMYPDTEQAALDRWSRGGLTEQAFVTESRWDEHWGYHWLYYRDIFVFARDNGLGMYALNAPRDVVTAVRRKGFKNLTPEEAAHVPSDVSESNDDHMTFFKASFEEGDLVHGGMNEEMWRSMAAAQVAWDAAMGFHAVKTVEAVADPNAIMVVMVGSGHVAYGVGIERQARRWFKGGIATLIPVPTFQPDGEINDKVQASYANYVWGIPGESDTLFPSLGLALVGGAGGRRQVLQVDQDSLGAKAGFAVNDLIVSVDGHPVPDKETLNAVMADKRWGDAITVVVSREGEDTRRSPSHSAAWPAPHRDRRTRAL